MNIPETEREYPAFDLYELASRIKVFLEPYPFVESAYLYHGADIGKYHIIFRVPTVPDRWGNQGVPQETNWNADRFKDLFKAENLGKQLLSESQGGFREITTGVDFYREFFRNVLLPTLNSAQLNKVYPHSIQTNLKPLDDSYLYSARWSQGPLGLSRYALRLEKWVWDIAEEIDKILTGYYPIITSLEYKDDVRNLSLPDLVQPGEPFLLYERPNGEIMQRNVSMDKTKIQVPHEQIKPEEFVGSLSIAYDSDTEIKIKVGTKKSKTYSFADLGFSKKDSKVWRTIIEILQSRDHLYHLGVAHGPNKVRNKSYDSNRSVLREISKKFVSFLNKTFKLQLPEKYPIFDLVKNEHPGTYKLKFAVTNFSTNERHYGTSSKTELMAEIEKLSELKANLKILGDEDSEKYLYEIEDNLGAAVTEAVKKGFLTRNRAESYMSPKKENIFPSFSDVYEEEKPFREDF